MFRDSILESQAIDPNQDWSHVNFQAAGGLTGYIDSRFRDIGDENNNERWLSGQILAPRRGDFDLRHWRVWASINNSLANRTLFYTMNGYIGIGPQFIQVDDRLCVINDCHLPVLLRAEGSGDVLVGAVYVYGLSKSEPLGWFRF